MAHKLKMAFKSNQVEMTYFVVTRGIPNPEEGKLQPWSISYKHKFQHMMWNIHFLYMENLFLVYKKSIHCTVYLFSHQYNNTSLKQCMRR